MLLIIRPRGLWNRLLAWASPPWHSLLRRFRAIWGLDRQFGDLASIIVQSPPAAKEGTSPVVIVAGPTASGKSALALALAEALGGTVINADSLQCYRDLRILTARPDPAAEARAPHRLYGFLDAAEPGSAGRWRASALSEIAAAAADRRLPIVVGGSGLYLRVLTGGLAPIPEIPDRVRQAAQALFAAEGGATFRLRLARLDRAAAETARGRLDRHGGGSIEGREEQIAGLAGRQPYRRDAVPQQPADRRRCVGQYRPAAVRVNRVKTQTKFAALWLDRNFRCGMLEDFPTELNSSSPAPPCHCERSEAISGWKLLIRPGIASSRSCVRQVLQF